MANETEPRTVTLTRRFAVPRERLFAAWTERDHVARWFGPPDVTCTIHEWDARAGGAYRLTMHDGDGDDMPLSGIFREISAPERLVLSWIWGAGDMAGRETLLTLAFEEDGDGTLLRLRHSLLPDAEWARRHRAGWDGCFDSLAASLAG